MATKPSPLNAFRPNEVVSFGAMRIIVFVQVAFFLVLWIQSPFPILPRPGEVFGAIGRMWQGGLGQELLTSLQLNIEAIVLTAIISIGLSYLTVMPFFRPIVNAFSKGRFLSLTGFSLLFMLVGATGHSLKLALLVFGMTVFFLTSMASVVSEIPKESFDHARTLRMSEWRTVWEVVVLGTADKALEVLRQNAAIGWMMLTMVEGIVRGEGGIGVALVSQQKYLHLPEVFGIQLLILTVGIIQDFAIGGVRRLVCPYADLKLERKK
jgi:NitT/TauT family transport system permease protein